MADHRAPDQTGPGEDVVAAAPDYPLEPVLELDDAAQYRALFEDTRKRIVSLLLERAATTTELAHVLGKPKGTVGHHLKVLEDAGLVRVVRTERVRALEARYYGRTARTFLYLREHEAVGEEQRLLAQAAAEIAQVPAEGAEISANMRTVRISAERAREWKHRLDDLVAEFADEPRGGTTTYTLVYGLYATALPALGTTTASDDGARS